MSEDDAEFTEEELAVDELRSAGADLSQRRRVDHYLYFPARVQADAAAAEVRRLDLGLEPTIDLDPESDNWLLLASHEIVVSVPELSRLRERMSNFAAAHGGEYDGWNIAVAAGDEDGEDGDDWRTFRPD